ncbi:MAG: hypothetical protein LBU32_01110 [Clostridiales bacterium]|jgi:hypothetical protein|nr:hypothetical protein [Clostridiales bacterium]
MKLAAHFLKAWHAAADAAFHLLRPHHWSGFARFFVAGASYEACLPAFKARNADIGISRSTDFHQMFLFLLIIQLSGAIDNGISHSLYNQAQKRQFSMKISITVQSSSKT